MNDEGANLLARYIIEDENSVGYNKQIDMSNQKIINNLKKKVFQQAKYQVYKDEHLQHHYDLFSKKIQASALTLESSKVN
jgi:hypothetical protein